MASSSSSIPGRRPSSLGKRKRPVELEKGHTFYWREFRRTIHPELLERCSALQSSSSSETSPSPPPLFERSPSPSLIESPPPRCETPETYERYAPPIDLSPSARSHHYLKRPYDLATEADSESDADDEPSDDESDGGSIDPAHGFEAPRHSPVLPSMSSKRRRTRKPVSCYASGVSGGKGSGEMSADNPFGFADGVLRKAPGMRRLSFFVLQEHHATAKHFDLRLQCYDPYNPVAPFGTLSFALPKGILDLEPGRWRLAVQTPRHSIAYSEFEGGYRKPVMMYDAGSYRWIRSKRMLRARADCDPGTDIEDDIAMVDLHNQRWLRHKYRHGAFIVELNGVRHKRLRLFFKRLDETKYPVKKIPTELVDKKTGEKLVDRRTGKVLVDIRAPPRELARTVAHPQWICRLAVDERGKTVNEEDRTIGRRSIFSGLTMEEIRAYGATAKGRREFQRMLDYNKKHFGRYADDDAEQLDGYNSDASDANDLAYELPKTMRVD